jgi:pentatricopeptide repeat protein
MLSVYVSHALLDDAFALYDRMLAESGTRPDRFTFNTVLGACCGQSTLEQGQRIHADIISYGVEAHAGVGAGVIGMYTKCGSVESARIEFEREQSRDSALWNIMLAGYVRSDMAAQAVELYLDMVEKRVHPDEFTFATVVGACSSLADLAQGKEVHAAVVDDGYESDGGVRNALVHMYSRCGNMSDAWNLFERRADARDAIAWNAMITGYAQHGYGQEALEVYQKMLQQQQKQQQAMEADSATMAGVLLACAHVGLVEDGLGCFGAMLEADGILPCAEHYAGVVDLLGRAGRVSEAEALLEGVPIQPDAVMWRVLLGACRLHNEAGPGRRVAARIVELDVHCTLAYVLLSNIFASSSSSSSDQHLRIPPQQWP